jgi:hypothetical protein
MLLNYITKKTNQKFVDAKLEGTGAKSPRTGYYFIKSVNYKKVGINGEVLLAQANYKQDEDDYFVEGLVIEIAIRGLMFSNIEHPPLENDNHLVGQILYIYKPVWDVELIDGEPMQIIKALCHYSYEPVQFINESNADVTAFFGKHTNLKDAYEESLSSNNYDIAEALYWEAGGIENGSFLEDSIDYEASNDNIDYGEAADDDIDYGPSENNDESKDE